jgi:uncharacterized membrane protein (UPF0127 family)
LTDVDRSFTAVPETSFFVEAIVKRDPALDLSSVAKRLTKILVPAKWGGSCASWGKWFQLIRWLSLLLVASQVMVVRAGFGEPVEMPPGGGHRQATTTIFDRMARHTIRLVDDEGKTFAVEVKIARSAEERQAGFQDIDPEVIENSLILFVFAEETNSRFHMERVRAPLAIAFIAEDGEILDIQEMHINQHGIGRPANTYGPSQPFRYALEARAGFFRDHHVSPGKGFLRLP